MEVMGEAAVGHPVKTVVRGYRPSRRQESGARQG